MGKLKTSSPISRHRAMPRARAVVIARHERRARWTCSTYAPASMGDPMAATLGQLAGFWPSRPLWPCATVRPEGIVGFSIFPLDFFK
jgi:hypothetical protein